MSAEDLVSEVIAFNDARGWDRWHTPEALAKAISVEAAELLECYLWPDFPKAKGQNEPALELADVLILSLAMCRALGVTPESIVRNKLARNAEKYPV